MKIKNNTITVDRKDNILFDYPYISDGHMLIKLDVIFCFKFKFKFPEDQLTAAFINRTKFTYEHGRASIGKDCAWMPDFTQVTNSYDHNKVVTAEISPLQWNGARCVYNNDTGAHVWINEMYKGMLQGDTAITAEDAPIFNLMGGDLALVVMPLRVTDDPSEQKMLHAMVACMCNKDRM